MKGWTRRELLAALAVGVPSAAALTALRPMFHGSQAQPRVGLQSELPELAYPTPALDSALVYRNTAGGTVVSATSTEIIVDGQPDGEVRIYMDASTVHDDGFWTAALPISPGDSAIATGEPYKGGLKASKLWINARDYIGEVLELYGEVHQAPLRFRMRDRYDLTPYHTRHPEGHIVLIDPRTMVVGLPTQAAQTSSGVHRLEAVGQRQIELEGGQVIEAVGHEYQGVLQCVSLFLE